MLLLCAQPALTETSRVALTLRAVTGLATRQIAALLFTPEATLAQRTSRAKAAIRATGPTVAAPTPSDLPARLHAVRYVLYLTFTAGCTAASGPHLMDVELVAEAIWMTEQLHRAVPDDPETTGLLALLLLTHARAAARTDARGDLVPLPEQDRSRWERDLLDRGVALNLAVAVGMAHGPDAGIAALRPLLEDPTQRTNHRLYAAHAHLLERAGRHGPASETFTCAAQLATSVPEQRYLHAKAAHAGGRGAT